MDKHLAERQETGYEHETQVLITEKAHQGITRDLGWEAD